MPRGRPPGSKNKNSQQKQSLFAENTEVNVKQTAAEPVAHPVVKNLEKFCECIDFYIIDMYNLNAYYSFSPKK